VHRDLKPSNLLVSRLATACTVAEECVYVTDFGLAKLDALDSSLSASGDVLGTPGFMAPEQANAGAKVDERTDVYGLGATLYACLSGRPPLVADDLVSALRRIGEEEPPPLRKLCRGQVDEDLQTIVHACLHKEAARRYPTAGSLADDLDHWLDGAAIDARPPRLRHRLGRFLQRRRSTIRVGATVAGLAVLVLGWVVVQAEIARRTERRVGDAAVALTNRVENLLADAEDLFRSGAFQARRLRLERSEAMCREFLAQYDMPRPHHLLARVLRQGERYAEALAELDTALSDAPELIEARFERGLLLAEFVGRSPFHGGPDKSLLPHYRAQAVADLRVVEEPGFTRRYAFRQRDVLFGKAELARLRGDPMKSREFLLAIANDLDPTHLPSILCLANLAFETGNTEEARVWSARSIDLFRGAAPAYRAGGVAMSVPTALESGIPVFNHADVVAGRVPPARVLLRGTVRLQSGDFDGAREDFEWVSGRECEQRARAFEGLGRTHLELGRIHAEQTQTVNAVAEWAAALDAFERAIALDTELGWALLGRGEVRLLQAGHLRAAGFPTEAVRTEGEGRADLRRAAGLGPTAVASQAERLLRPR
ncbi:MAG: protein kinase, partial [Planctomycetes bacterium]|nr:protein kinase [Planctomycetota bacterium]